MLLFLITPLFVMKKKTFFFEHGGCTGFRMIARELNKPYSLIICRREKKTNCSVVNYDFKQWCDALSFGFSTCMYLSWHYQPQQFTSTIKKSPTTPIYPFCRTFIDANLVLNYSICSIYAMRWYFKFFNRHEVQLNGIYYIR